MFSFPESKWTKHTSNALGMFLPISLPFAFCFSLRISWAVELPNSREKTQKSLKPPKIHFGTRIGPTICLEQAVGWSYCILLMVQKSGVHQLRLVVYPIIYDGFCTSNRWLFGISEPSTVVLAAKNQHQAFPNDFFWFRWLYGVGKSIFGAPPKTSPWMKPPQFPDQKLAPRNPIFHWQQHLIPSVWRRFSVCPIWGKGEVIHIWLAFSAHLKKYSSNWILLLRDQGEK